MAKNRDNFTSPTIEKLRSRVGNRCSNPECRVPTTGPSTNPEKINNIGVAAHITAAASGGPRYDKSLNQQQRKSITNAIWLCANCSRDIDNNPEKYSIELLNEWKELAEKKAENELGTKLPDDNYVINSLTSALTGQSNIFLPKVISNAHNATSNALEILDSRFRVETKFNDGVTHFNIHAKKNVAAKLQITPNFAKEFIEKFTDFQDHGDKLTIDSSAVSIKGSPLLEKINNNIEGKFEITSSLTKQAVVQIWLVSPDSTEKLFFNDFVGQSVLGRKSLTTNCESLNGLMSMRIRFAITEHIPDDGKFSFIINFNKWDKVPLVNLPYFDKIKAFYQKIYNGWKFHFSLEIEGLQISKGYANDILEQETITQTLSHLNFINSIKSIAQILGKPIIYDDSFEYNSEFHTQVNQLKRILSGGVSLSGDSINGNAKCTLEASKDLSNIVTIMNSKEKLTSLKIDQVEPEQIAPFKQQITLPKFSHRLTEVKPIVNAELEDITPGDLVEVEWEPTSNCMYIIEKL